MISFFQFLANGLAVVHTEGNGWLRDMNWGGIPEGKAREERDLRVGLGTAGGPSAWQNSRQPLKPLLQRSPRQP